MTDVDGRKILAKIEHEAPHLPVIQWTPDGRGIAACSRVGGTSNIVVHPLDGGAPVQLTHFKEADVLGFAWSPDGSSLALTRSMHSSDVVLITGFLPANP